MASLPPHCPCSLHFAVVQDLYAKTPVYQWLVVVVIVIVVVVVLLLLQLVDAGIASFPHDGEVIFVAGRRPGSRPGRILVVIHGLEGSQRAKDRAPAQGAADRLCSRANIGFGGRVRQREVWQAELVLLEGQRG